MSDFMVVKVKKYGEGLNDPIIKCQRRVSKFNRSIFKQLNVLNRNKIIEEVKFDGLFYHFKQNKRTRWIEVTNMEVLDHWNLELKRKTGFNNETLN